MTRMRAAAAVAATVTALGVGLPVTAQAAPGPTYTCATVSPIFYVWENFVLATGCQGPLGPHRSIAIVAVPPGFSRSCDFGDAFVANDNLHVTGRQCT